LVSDPAGRCESAENLERGIELAFARQCGAAS
jgi:hypothetical protein